MQVSRPKSVRCAVRRGCEVRAGCRGRGEFARVQVLQFLNACSSVCEHLCECRYVNMKLLLYVKLLAFYAHACKTPCMCVQVNISHTLRLPLMRQLNEDMKARACSPPPPSTCTGYMNTHTSAHIFRLEC